MEIEQEKQAYSNGEKILIALAFALFSLMTYCYIFDISIKRWFFPGDEDRFLSTPIGRVTTLKGGALRQRAAEFEFKNLAPSMKLYPNDTLMTGPGGALEIELEGGQKFTLNPNSLVKLSFGSDFSITGVVRIRIEVLRSPTQVTYQKTEDEQPKEPLVITGASPEHNAAFSFTEAEYSAGKKDIPVAFNTNRKGEKLTMHIFLPETGSQPRRELTSAVANMDGTKASALFSFSTPGAYEWEAHDSNGRVVGPSHAFSIDPKIMMIHVLPTLNSTNRLEGTATKKTFDGFILRWQPVKGSGHYIVQVYKFDNARAILKKEMNATRLILNKNNLLLGKLQYTVERPLGGGFVAVSEKHSFGFEFVPPELTAPSANATFTSARLEETNRVIFFTWTKTNYTDAYDFELAVDPDFRRISVQKSLRDNYFSISAPSNGRYYWRVRSQSHGMWSDFSEIRILTISR